jgi:hypothetical protein
MEAVIAIGEDGVIDVEYNFVPGWGDALDDFTGSYDFATNTFQMDVLYADMNFVQTWVKE